MAPRPFCSAGWNGTDSALIEPVGPTELFTQLLRTDGEAHGAYFVSVTFAGWSHKR